MYHLGYISYLRNHLYHTTCVLLAYPRYPNDRQSSSRNEEQICGTIRADERILSIRMTVRLWDQKIIWPYDHITMSSLATNALM